MSNIFVYDGNNTQVDWQGIWADGYTCFYFQLAVYYGNFVETQGVPFTTTVTGPTSGFPVLPDSAVNGMSFTIYRNGVGKYEKCKYVGRFPIINDSGEYLGENFIFITEGMLQSGNNQYYVDWNVGNIKVPFGPDLLVIKGRSGRAGNFNPND